VKKGVAYFTMQPSTTALRTYTADVIPVLEQVTAEVEYANIKHYLTAQIVAAKAPNLLGKNWLQQIKLNWPKHAANESHGRRLKTVHRQ